MEIFLAAERRGNLNVPTDAAVLAGFGLRTSPFSPSIIGPKADPVAREFFEQPFDPNTTPDILDYYYYDFYHLGKKQVDATSLKSMFEQFPPRGGPPSTLVLVSGNSKSGRKSLANRIIKKITDDDAVTMPAEKPPLVVPVTFFDKDVDANVGQVAEFLVTLFESEHAGGVADLLRKQLTTAMAQNTMAAYAGFFQKYKLFAPPVTRRSVIFRISADQDDYNSWTAAYMATRSIARCMIIETGSPGTADATVNVMSTNDAASVFHIRAAQLKHETGRGYIRDRLSHERTMPVLVGHEIGDLAPFTDAAVEELFAPAKEGIVVGLEIGKVRKMLDRAMERHIAKLKEMREHDEDAALPASELAIGKRDMRIACDLVSRGI